MEVGLIEPAVCVPEPVRLEVWRESFWLLGLPLLSPPTHVLSGPLLICLPVLRLCPQQPFGMASDTPHMLPVPLFPCTVLPRPDPPPRVSGCLSDAYWTALPQGPTGTSLVLAQTALSMVSLIPSTICVLFLKNGPSSPTGTQVRILGGHPRHFLALESLLPP